MQEAFPIASEYALHIHHYVSTYQAKETLHERVALANKEWAERSHQIVRITEGALLPQSLQMTPNTDATMLSLCGKYYDDDLYQRLKEHCDETGQSDMKLGYANCALPVVLEHNTPNNSISLLWAETTGTIGSHAMRPLFRRRDRHG